MAVSLPLEQAVPLMDVVRASYPTTPSDGSLSAIVLLALMTLAATGYWNRYLLTAARRNAPKRHGTGRKPQTSEGRCIVQKMNQAEMECVVFFGSQTGNGQSLAEKLAKELSARFNLRTMLADLDDYDYETLIYLPPEKLAIFILSSYGEGEPTDNAVNFYNFITAQDPEPRFSEEKGTPLQPMRYAAFGLGNSTYEQFNAVVRKVDASLLRLGARRIVETGEGDDSVGTMEEDFLAWKDKLWVALSEEMGCTAQENVKHERSFSVLEGPASADSIYRGERSENELAGLGRYDPHVARVISSRELFQAPDRNCLHLEVDLSDSGQSYQTGDHVGIWASNSDIEVDRFLRVFGLIDKRHTTIQISSIDQTHRCPLPTPTTYEAAVRYYLEICGPVSRQSLSVLADHCNEPAQRGALLDLSTDRDRFLREVSGQQMNLAQVLQSISPEGTWLVPFEILIEGVRPLQPRYYSISSSSRVSPSRLSITVGVESVELQDHCFKGVASNYLLALHRAQIAGHHKGLQLGYDFTGPRSRYNLSIPIHIRSSRFRLPADAACPVIMIGPGTGVAPFLAFVQERRAEAEAGALIGDMVLFFGCRRKSEDFLYSEFWKESTDALGGRFRVYTAFSRQVPGQKVYVQHHLTEHSAEVRSLLCEKSGYLYVCGAARMAREVQQTLAEILGVSGLDGDEAVRRLKAEARFQEDVW